MITYEVSKADIERVQKKLKGMEKDAPKVIKNAINKTAREARRKLAEGAQSAYTVKMAGWNSRMKIQNATVGNLEAIIRVKDRPLTTTRFSHRANKKKQGGAAASADIVKGGLKEIISRYSGTTGTRIKAFKANGLIMQRQTVDRLPVKVLRSNSVPKMIEKVYQGERGIDRQLKDTINQALQRNIGAEIEKLL